MHWNMLSETGVMKFYYTYINRLYMRLFLINFVNMNIIIVYISSVLYTLIPITYCTDIKQYIM